MGRVESNDNEDEGEEESPDSEENEESDGIIVLLYGNMRTLSDIDVLKGGLNNNGY